MNRKISIAALGAAGVLALGAGVPALAASSDSTPSPGATADGQLREDLEERRAAAEQDFADRLAEELGVDAEEVAAALEKVRGEMQAERQAEHLSALEERLDQAVENGDLTRAQADAILEAAEKGVFPGRGGPGGPGGFGGGFRGHGGHHGPGGFSDRSGDSATEGTSTVFSRV